MEKNKGALREQLNRLGKEWFEAREQKDKNVCMTLETDIFLLADQIFKRSTCGEEENEVLEHLYSKDNPDLRAALGEFFIRDWQSFDPNKGALYDFMLARLNFRAADIYHKDYAIRKRKRQNPQPGESKTEYCRIYESLDALRGDEKELTLGSRIADERPLSAEYDVEYNERVAELIVLILLLPKKLNKRENNLERLTYFRMFFTDGIVDAIHKLGVTEGYIKHERDLFEAMKVSFLDFFMRDICRTTDEIFHSQLKLHGEMVEGQLMKEPGHPLPQNVYRAYLKINCKKTVGNQSISNQRKAYCAFLERVLC